MPETATIGNAKGSFLGKALKKLREPDSFLFSQLFRRSPPAIRRALGSLLEFNGFHALVNLRYIAARKLLPDLSPVGARVVGDLRKDGIAFCHVSDLGLTAEFEGLKDYFASLLEERERNAANRKSDPGGEEFLIRLGGDTVLTGNDVISKFLVEGQLAAISGHYLGMVPRFVGRYIWRTLVVKKGERVSSQRWHRDYEDTHISKVFLYLNDVGPENGPTEFVRGSNKQGALGSIPPGRDRDEFGIRKYPSEAELQPYAEVMEKNRVTCTAKAGTLIFVDSYGYHRGGYCKEGHRDMMIFHFATAANLHHVGYKIEGDFGKSLSKFMRIVFGL